MRKCEVPGCERKHEAKGKCMLHYLRFKRHQTYVARPIIKCAIPGCTDKHYGRGYCQKHYKKIVFKQAEYQKRRYSGLMSSHQKKCLLDNCKSVTYAKGLCRNHYNLQRNAGRLFCIKHDGVHTLHLHLCKTCNTPFFQPSKTAMFCSRKCFGEAKRGGNNWNWKGGVAEYPDHSILKKLRLQKLLEANFVCHFCGGEATETHHLDKDKSHQVLENLIAVCHKCHMGNFHRQKHKSSYRDKYGLTLSEIQSRCGMHYGKIKYFEGLGKLEEILTKENS